VTPRLLTALAVALLGAAPLGAQARPAAERLAARLDPATRQQVLVEVEAARAAGLPTEKLVDRALEGASKRAPGPRIVIGVRRLRAALAESRTALGTSSTPIEVEAGASAIEANVGSRVLAGLRRARPDGSLTVPLAVLTDLVAYGVPVDTAARTVLAVARARDAALVAYQRDVERDISVGAVPATAASLRAGALERALLADTRSATPGLSTAGAENAGRVNRPIPPRKP
jgi:hypothetical protein